MHQEDRKTLTVVRLKFYKRDEFKYLSHLDISRILIRAISRAGIIIKKSEGFHPKPKINFSNPLSLGIESRAEYCDISVLGDFKLETLIENINSQLKDQMNIIEGREINGKIPGLMKEITLIEYHVFIKNGREDHGDGEPVDKIRNYIESRQLQGYGISSYSANYDKKGNLIFLKLYVYAKILKNKNNIIFKLNSFLEEFKNYLCEHSSEITDIYKNEMFILKENKLVTPLESVNWKE